MLRKSQCEDSLKSARALIKLQFHSIKTKFVVVGSTYNLNTKSGNLSNVIFIDNNLVSRIPSNKCLGVLLDEGLANGPSKTLGLAKF